MKALFIHDHKFLIHPNGEIFSNGQFPYAVWQRYLKHFDELIVAGRSLPLSDTNLQNLNISSGKRVQFVFLPNLASVSGVIRHRLEVKKTLQQLIASVDAVIARTSLLSKISYPIAEKTGTPWAAEVVGCSWDAYWNYGSIQSKLLAPLAYYSQRQMVSHAKHAIYVTQNFLQKRYPCFGVTTGVSNVELPSAEPHIMDQRIDKISNPGKPFVFGLIGSLSCKYKGIQTAFSALKKIHNQLPDFELQILGGGDSKPWMRLAESLGVAQNVRFLGTLPAGKPVLEWLDRVDLYLQPSFTEGLPRSLAEATSRACPAIGSTAGGIPELLDLAVLHKPGDVDRLSTLIMESLDTQWRQCHARKNYKTSKQYTREVLNAQRDSFWASFAEFALNQKQLKG
ncbi:glycosyltransferase family 4 protein [Desulfogranum mediterraneum]|uniref:glycosyltransferase family 4 protein n=1 Tax=Desulfogranum mediterraneum TaxID=160661 RepID=UPI00040A603A|nr:glycosyltransferase family 4 protein [Desulfogranum mediterraneum]